MEASLLKKICSLCKLQEVKLAEEGFKLSVRKIFKRKRRSAECRRSHKKFPLSIYEVCFDIKYNQNDKLYQGKTIPKDCSNAKKKTSCLLRNFVFTCDHPECLQCRGMFSITISKSNLESGDDMRWERVSLSWNNLGWSLLEYAR